MLALVSSGLASIVGLAMLEFGWGALASRRLLLALSLPGLLLSFCLAYGLFHVLPLMRAQSHERGRLEGLTDVLRRRSSEMERAAQTDVLTGLGNRRHFDAALQRRLVEARSDLAPTGLIVIDLDRFKAINDTYGHDIGDEVLRAVADCLTELTRSEDVVARMGGEEFAILVPRIGDADFGPLADRIREGIEALSLEVGNVRLHVTASIGLAISDCAGNEDAAAFYKRADVNLYRAKRNGRNRICA